MFNTFAAKPTKPKKQASAPMGSGLTKTKGGQLVKSSCSSHSKSKGLCGRPS